MDPLLSDLLTAIRATPRPVDQAKVTAAWEFASLAHSGQLRKSGDPFITHPIQVAKILALWNLDTTTVVAGLLHDTVEDGGATLEDLVEKFGQEVADIVNGVTKVTSIDLGLSQSEAFIENLRKMFLVMAQDLRVVMVKFADRIHNLQTLSALKPEKQLSKARSTLEIYAPLADRLGMGEIKAELEDLAFPYVYPKEYQDLQKTLKSVLSTKDKFLTKFHRQLSSLVVSSVPDAEILIRQKHLYSLFKKLGRPEISGDISKVHDLYAARVLVDTKDQCYQVLGLIHEKFHPVPYLGVSDFIATPKPNGYQSLHTKVFGPEGRIVEIQIRTWAMHRQAEMGAAAHWQYTQAKSAGASDQKLEGGLVQTDSKLSWVKELLSWQEEIKDNSEYIKTLKFDALQKRLLVFSPKGDVFDLPAGATPVDFAYAVHTDLGSQISGAKVNGKMVPLNFELKNGNVVELLVDRKRKSPSRDWLDFAVTTTARREISKIVKN